MMLVSLYNPAGAESDPLQRDDPPRWGFGEGLDPGDSFQYRICDSPLRVAESPDPCYVATLRFLDLLPNHHRMVWVVAAHIDHGENHVDMILHVSESFEMEADPAAAAYADSLERTLAWAATHASSLKPGILAVGRSWGTVAAGTEGTDLMVNRVDYLDGQTYPVYVVGYNLAKESFLHIKDGFPFPLKAVIYRPISSFQNGPAAFTFDLLSYNAATSDCELHVGTLPTSERLESQTNATGFPADADHTATSEFEELLDDDSDDEFDIISSEMEISEIETNSTEANSTSDEFMPTDLNHVFGNFTKFIQNITNLTSQIIKNQSGN